VAEPIDSIETALVATIEAADVPAPTAEDPNARRRVLLDVHPVELPDLGQLPAGTLLFAGPAQQDGATGGLTDNEWRWIFRIYVSVQDFRIGQQQMKDAIPAVLAALRRNPTLNDTCDRLVIRDRGDPQYLRTRKQLVKTLELVAETEEV
jgi:hypothetical protein